MGTYSQRAGKISAFYKWLTQPDIPKPDERQDPPQLKGLRYPRRKVKTSVKREDLWTHEEHKVFLERCQDLRLACYHAIALETGGRPSELLAVKIKDMEIKTSPSTGKKYAEFWIGRYGKSRKARPATISDALPFFNVWTHVHPNRDDPTGNAYLFPPLEKSAKYRQRKPLEEDSLRMLYSRTMRFHFPRLLEDPTIPLEVKATIKTLLKKPHYPYLRRHEFGTEIVPRVPQYVFNQLMGHSKTSKMYEVYVQDLGTEGNRELQIAKGIITRDEIMAPAKLEMQPKYCPICHEANKHNADFCFSCNWVISKKGMYEVRESDAKALQEKEKYKKKFEELETRQKQLELEGETRQQQQIAEMNAKLETTQDQVAALLQMLTSVSEEESATTGSKKNFLLRKLGVLTNGKIGEDPNDPSIVVEPVGSSSGPCTICGEETSGMIKVETPAKYTTAIKDTVHSLQKTRKS